MAKSKRNGAPRAAILDSGDIPFINVSHPSQIVAPHLVTFVRQQAQRKYKKETPTKKEPDKIQADRQENENEGFTTFVSLPQSQAAYTKFNSPTCLYISPASAM